MAVWNKIASTLALSMSLAVLGAACAAPDEEPSATPDDAAQAEDAREGTAMEALPRNPDRSRRPDRGRDWGRRAFERCARGCDSLFRDCVRASGREVARFRGLCHARQQQCREDCWTLRWD